VIPNAGGELQGLAWLVYSSGHFRLEAEMMILVVFQETMRLAWPGRGFPGETTRSRAIRASPGPSSGGIPFPTGSCISRATGPEVHKSVIDAGQG